MTNVYNNGAVPIVRTFQDIPDDKNSEAEQTTYLVDLGWSQGSTWEELLKSRRVLIISEAGAGKTYECQTEQQRLWNAGEPAFYLELAALSGDEVHSLLTSEERIRYDGWRASSTDVATFFLDSVDELKLSLGSFQRALKRLENATAGQLRNTRIIITSRPIPIDAQLFRKILPIPNAPIEIGDAAEAFADMAMADRSTSSTDESAVVDWRNVALLPLSNAQMRQMAINEGVTDPDALIADIKRRNAEDFARRPQDLIELCADWREHRRIRTHRDQVASNAATKLKPREDRAERTPLSPDKASEGARRLALAAMLSRKLTIRHSAEADRGTTATEAPLDPALILHDWTPDERTTLLERALFGFASYGRVRFHHRSVIEYLAAEHLLALIGRGMTTKAIKRLLFSTTAQGAEIVKPSLKPVAAWMALKERAVFEEVLAREPDILLIDGDPESLTLAQRQAALRAYVERHKQGGWRGLRVPHIQLHRFAAPELEPELRRLWDSGIENPEVREVLLNVIALGKMAGCADIAYGVATSPDVAHGERIDALDALIQLEDPRLEPLGELLPHDVEGWPDGLARSALVRLFPAHLSVNRLCETLARVTEKKRSLGAITWNLPRIIEQTDFATKVFDDLRHGLTTLIFDGLTADETKYPNLRAKRSFLLPALAATCLKLVQRGEFSSALWDSTVLVLRLSEHREESTEQAKLLRTALSGLPIIEREILFRADDAFVLTHQPQPSGWKRYVRTVMHGSLNLTLEDLAWIIPWLADQTAPPDEREMMLEAAIRLRASDVVWIDHLIALKLHVCDLPELVARLDKLAEPSPSDPEEDRWQAQDARRQAKEKKDRLKARASWAKFWHEIATDPDKLSAPDQSKNAAWNLWEAMKRGGDDSRASGWNRALLESYFEVSVVDRLRAAMMKFWRDERPTLRHERAEGSKDTYWTSWEFGLAGLSAEAEDPAWISSLRPDEVELAFRYAYVSFGRIPSWLDALAEAHPSVCDQVWGTELTSELADSPHIHRTILESIRYGPANVARTLVPRLRAWLDRAEWRTCNDVDASAHARRLRHVLEMLIKHGDAGVRAHVEAIAIAQLGDGATDPLTSVWLPILLQLNPERGIDALEKTVSAHPPTKFGPAIEWFSSLFGDRHGEGDSIVLSADDFTPTLLLRLARLSYRYVRPADDMVREGGSYSPKPRDHAERGRGAIVYALLSKAGPDAWRAKIELANDPLFADFKDRAMAIARDRAAEEADTFAFGEADIVKLDRFDELPPLTRDEMFLLLTDRLDDIDESLLRDDSPRAGWAIIDDEKVMRRAIARELRLTARQAYTVDQEAATADEKETDIRLRTANGTHEAVIELKLGEKERSGLDLRNTLRDQLVVKYMAAENCKAGCLLITCASDRIWHHPDTGAKLDLAGLIEMLNDEATKIEQEMGGSLRLTARGLDLRPRLLTERAKG